MANEPVTTPIHDLYAQRFAADLETNRKEQADLTAQIKDLEGRLNQLKADELWLCGVQGVMPPAGESAPASETPAPAKAPTTSAVPRPRQARKSTGGTTRAKKAAQTRKASGAAAPDTETKTAARKPATRKSAAKPAAAKAAEGKAVEGKAKPTVAAARTVDAASTPASEKTAGATRTAARAKKTVRTDEPPLRELVHAMLVKAAEPRMVSEVAAELTQTHPGRAASGQVVRNTLEGLVKKGQIEKEHRQGSVMYTAVQPTTADPAAGVTVAAGQGAEGPVADAVAEPPVADPATAPAPAS
ncbi:hypothetical protein [Streptomyces sp. A1136]|uniref:hypothetical protein n=1 Tax=Streptomyces sp. A1136 TaxID=2563102 RepID=UPI001445C7E2|nr:hypothetical protein [Streptomyces sp. A1136]